MKRRNKIPPLHKLNWTRPYSLTGGQASRWAKHYPHATVFLWRMEENDSITYTIAFHTFCPGSAGFEIWRRLDPLTAQAVIHYINENLLPGEVTDEVQK